MRAKEDPQARDEDSSQENQGGRLHQGLQGAVQRDLRTVREEQHSATVRYSGEDGPHLRDQQKRREQQLPDVGTNVRLCDQMNAEALFCF